VIVTADGYIVTNRHVIDGADEVQVAVGKRNKIYDAKVVGADPATDVSVLKIAATGRAEGDIRYRRIAIEAGGEIAGEVEIGTDADEAEAEPRISGLTGTGA